MKDMNNSREAYAPNRILGKLPVNPEIHSKSWGDAASEESGDNKSFMTDIQTIPGRGDPCNLARARDLRSR